MGLYHCNINYGVGLYRSLVTDFLVIIGRLYALMIKSAAEIRKPRISGLHSKLECKYFNPQCASQNLCNRHHMSVMYVT